MSIILDYDLSPPIKSVDSDQVVTRAFTNAAQQRIVRLWQGLQRLC